MAQKDRWYLFQEVPNYNYLHAYGCFHGFNVTLKKHCGVQLKYGAMYFYDGHSNIYFTEKDWQRAGKEIFEKIKNNPKFVVQLFKKIEKAAKDVWTVSRKLQKIDPRVLSDKELMKAYNEFNNVQLDLWRIGMVQNPPDYENELVSKYLLNFIGKKIKELNLPYKKAEVYSALITAGKPTYLEQEAIELFKIYERIFKDKKLNKIFHGELPSIKKSLLAYPKLLKEIEAHRDKYCWIQYNWIGPSVPLDSYIEILSGLVKQKESPEKQEKISKEKKAKRKEFQKILVKLKPDPVTKHLFNYAKEITHLKMVRMDALYFGYYSFEAFAKEIAKRLNLSLNQVYAICPWKIEAVFAGRHSLKALNDKLHRGVLLNENGKIKEFYGDKAVKELQKIQKNMRKEKLASIFNGMPAYPGKVIGRVKIILSPKDLPKMEEGAIMVSNATSPDLVPAMKMAAAILTDMGGITCHASIISREMKIPCVIGTKIATRALKDDDLVEVDANHGQIKKVK